MSGFGSQQSSFGAGSGTAGSSSSSRVMPTPRASSGGNAFAPKRPSSLSTSFAASETQEEEEDESVGTLHTQPAAYARGDRKAWSDGGRSIGVCVNGASGETVTWVRKRQGDKADEEPKLARPAVTQSDRTVFMSVPHDIPRPVYEMYGGSEKYFTGLQQIQWAALQEAGNRHDGAGAGLFAPPQAETVKYIRGISEMYRRDLELLQGSDIDGEEQAKWAAAHQIFELAEILFLPGDGRGEGLIGEELLDWVNKVDPGPDNPRGNDIMQTKNPWEHDNFWPYIHRCLLRGFFVPAAGILDTLQNHPNADLAEISKVIANSLRIFPRSHNVEKYPVDHLYLDAHARWLSRFQNELVGAGIDPAASEWLGGGADLARTEKDLRTLVDIMEGKAEKVLEQSDNWREALGAWGILVKVNMSRDEVPEVTKRIMRDIPVDQTSDVQIIESLLCSGETTLAALKMYELNTWLAAHLGDIMDKMLLLNDDENKYDLSLRDFFLLEYAELLQGSTQGAGLWRIIAGYLAMAGAEGKRRLAVHVMRTSLRLNVGKSQETTTDGDTGQANGHDNRDGMEIDAGDHATEAQAGRFSHMQEVLEVCDQYALDRQRTEIMRIAADELIRRGEYGVAAAMCMKASDVYGIGKLADRVVDIYIHQGAEAYLRIIETLPPTLLSDAPAHLEEVSMQGVGFGPNGNAAQTGMISSQLAFLGSFRDYLLFVQYGELHKAGQALGQLIQSVIAPRGFWAILLAESIDLLEGMQDDTILFDTNATLEVLRTMEEVQTGSETAPEAWLGALATLLAARSAATDEEGATSAVTADTERSAKRSKTQANGSSDRSAGRVDRSRRYEAAREKLEAVRLACARNLARTMVDDMDRAW